MLSVLTFLIVLSVLVLFHEFGHFLAARIFGVKVDEFGIGFPPRALGYVRDRGTFRRVQHAGGDSYRKTVWTLNWLPLGGFVRLKGEQGNAADDPDSFAAQPMWRRASILVAGVVMNWVLAILIFTIGFSVGIPAELSVIPDGAIVRDAHVEIQSVAMDSGAANAGIEPGDRLVVVSEKPVSNTEEALYELRSRIETGESVHVVLRRNDRELSVDVLPSYLDAAKGMAIGVGLADVGVVRFPVSQAIQQGSYTTYAYTRLILGGFASLISDLFIRHKTSADLSGPIGIAVMTGQIARQGAWALAQFAALLSINLAIINILPIPALDGGRLLFVIIEAFRRKKTNAAFEAKLHQWGFIVLMVLIVFVTAQDLHRYGGLILHGLRSIVGLT